MRAIFGMSRYLVYIAVLGLLFAALAVFVFGGITSVTTTISVFQHGEFNAEGARRQRRVHRVDGPLPAGHRLADHLARPV